MRRLVVLLLFVFALPSVADKQESIKVKIITPVAVAKTKDVTAMFTDLKAEATNIGLNDAQLLGNIEYQKIGETNTRLSVTWHTLVKQSGRKGGRVQEQLANPLLSRFVVNTDRVDPNTEVTAVGSLDSLLDDVSDADKKIAEREQVELARNEEQNRKDEEKNSAPSSFGNTGGFNSGTQNYDDVNSGGENDNADIRNPVFVDCPPRIDIANGLVHEQKRMNIVGESGQIYELGECEDTDVSVQIKFVVEDCDTIDDYENGVVIQQTKMIATLNGERIEIEDCAVNPGFESPDIQVATYETCAPRIDLINDKVYEQQITVMTGELTDHVYSRSQCADTGVNVDIKYVVEDCGTVTDYKNQVVIQKTKKIASLNGERIDIDGCGINSGFSFPLIATYDKCGVRHDFDGNISVQQERFYYLDEYGAEIEVADCKDSAQSFAHYASVDGCSDVIDRANNIVIPYNRVAYKGVNNVVAFATDCRPAPTGNVDLKELYCTPKYQHDFQGGASYYITEFVYQHPTSGRQVVDACARSNKTSFQHALSTGTCKTEHDDANLVTRYFSLVQIDTPEDGIIVLDSCKERQNPVDYVEVSSGYVKVRKIGWMTYDSASNKACTTVGLPSLPNEPISIRTITLGDTFFDCEYYRCEFDRQITYRRGDASQYIKTVDYSEFIGCKE